MYKDQLEPVAMVDAAGAVLQRYVYGTKSHVPDYVLAAGVKYRIVSDHLGSVRLVVNASTGAVVQRMDYDEFGRVLADTTPGWQPFGYAGGIVDGDTGLVRFGARDYDAGVGRWTAKDPVRFDGGWNLYLYSFSNPVNYFDLNGLSVVCGRYGLGGNVMACMDTDPVKIPGTEIEVDLPDFWDDNTGVYDIENPEADGYCTGSYCVFDEDDFNKAKQRGKAGEYYCSLE